MESELGTRVLLSVQRALLGAVTPEMRAVEVEWSPSRIILRVFTEGEPSEEARADFDASVVTQVFADFPNVAGEDPRVEFEFTRRDAPAHIPVRGTLVFARAGVVADAVSSSGQRDAAAGN